MFPICFTLLEDLETLIIYRYNGCAQDGHLNITPEFFDLADHHNLNHHTPHLQIHFKLPHSPQVIYFKATTQMLHRNDMINHASDHFLQFNSTYGLTMGNSFEIVTQKMLGQVIHKVKRVTQLAAYVNS